jgi:hypothetical protein
MSLRCGAAEARVRHGFEDLQLGVDPGGQQLAMLWTVVLAKRQLRRRRPTS